MRIPVMDLGHIQSSDMNALMHTGFCYVKLPEHSLPKIKTCVEVARQFFKESREEKEKWKLKTTLEAGDKYQGYVLRSQSQNTNAIEQIFFEPDTPFGPYAAYAAEIDAIHQTFLQSIYLSLMQAIFTHLTLSHDHFIDATTHPFLSLVFQSCPSTGQTKDTIRLNAHKDFGLLTVLFFEEPGLEVKYEGEWQAIMPKKGYAVVNIGNALEKMTGGRCHSALHRVINATDDRISMVYFICPNYQRPVRNYIDDTIIAANGELFFKQQFAEYYEVSH